MHFATINQQISCFSLSICLLAISVLPAEAQSFVKRSHPTGHNEEPFITPIPSSFDKSYAEFNNSLSETGEKMRREYDKSNLDAAKIQEINNKAIQADTAATAQQSFVNTQVQAVTSGGLYNTPGTMVIGNPALMAPTLRGRYYSADRKGLYRNNGGGKF